ncbi:MAG: peptidylprolyl isomerase [Chloroflexota bacterium]|nr:peptidylprolyl isomerase [Chloroflexota bacterium]
MSFRSRPVLDRKHRPRWQDELRTQQLTVVAFAVAIALALGIFGAAAWNGYWESHFRPVAAVAGTTYDRADLAERERILAAETFAELSELQAQLGGPRDQILQQQIDSLSLAFNSLTNRAAQSLVDAQTLAARAEEFGVSVSDEELEAGLAERFTLPERVRASLVLVEALPEDAEPDDEPTDEQLAAAEEEAQGALERLEEGEEFAAVARDVSDDFTASAGGDLGWFEAEDPAYGEYFEALADADEGDLVGPVETDRGYAVLELTARRAATTEDGLRDRLAEQGIDEGTYREYVRGELLVDEFRDYFAEEVVTSPAAQQRVAQIVIAPVSGTVVPQERARHVLVQPDPELEDQAEATDEQWDAALEEAREVQELVEAEDADWFEIAEEHSDDTGSAARGGDLGWYDPANSPFVTEFAATATDLDVGEVSDPVRTDFGWHVIQKTGERESPQQQAADLVEELRADPDSFGEVAGRVSEDHETAQEGGELGWVAPYQLDAMLEEAVFALDEVGEISDPIETEDGITIYQLLESSESREIEDDRLEEIRSAGFDRWLEQEVRAPVETWLDPQYASTTAAG